MCKFPKFYLKLFCIIESDHKKLNVETHKTFIQYNCFSSDTKNLIFIKSSLFDI